MNIHEYAPLALRTSNNDTDQMNNAILGLIGESGEVVDVIKKHVHHDQPLNKDALFKEIGDVAWYLNLAVHSFDLSWADFDKDFEHNLQDIDLPMAALWLGWYTGTLADLRVRMIREGGTIMENAPTAKRCLGGLVRTLSVIAATAQLRWSDILEANVAKLKARFPEGFDSDRANNRDVEAEDKAVADQVQAVSNPRNFKGRKR